MWSLFEEVGHIVICFLNKVPQQNIKEVDSGGTKSNPCKK